MLRKFKLALIFFNLVEPQNQSKLVNRTDEKRTRLAKAVDELRGKLGPGAIKRGSSLR